MDGIFMLASNDSVFLGKNKTDLANIDESNVLNHFSEETKNLFKKKNVSTIDVWKFIDLLKSDDQY
jgi:hypothetical protein